MVRIATSTAVRIPATMLNHFDQSVSVSGCVALGVPLTLAGFMVPSGFRNAKARAMQTSTATQIKSVRMWFLRPVAAMGDVCE